MKKIPVPDLPTSESLAYAIYHSSGELLHDFGEKFMLQNVRAMISSGMRFVFVFDSQTEIPRFVREQRFHQISISKLEANEIVERTLYSDKGIALLMAGTALNPKLIESLQKKRIAALFREKMDEELDLIQVRQYFGRIASSKTIGEGILASLSLAGAAITSSDTGIIFRKHTRVEKEAVAKYKVRTDAKFKDRPSGTAKILDFSQGGARIRTISPFEAGSVVDMVIYRGGRTLAFTVRIVRCSPLPDGQFESGTTFVIFPKIAGSVKSAENPLQSNSENPPSSDVSDGTPRT